jgi:NifU-like protein involved in Fe-S cluster formation
MVDLYDLYSDRIMEMAANMPRAPRLHAPDATASAHSKLCGSKITVDITMENGAVTGYGHDVKACLLGQTSAAIVAASIIGTPADEIRAVGAQMRRMLKEGGQPPSGKWGNLAILQPVRDYKARHASTLLVFDAVEDALRQIEMSRAAKTGAAGE